MTSMRTTLAAAGAALVLVAAGCGGGGSSSNTNIANSTPNPGAPEKSPPGDIPDNQAFVTYSPPGGRFAVKVPEGWARTTASGGATSFTDKLNTVTVESVNSGRAADRRRGARDGSAELARTVKAVRGREGDAVTRKAGTAVRMTYLADAPPDPVTGKRRPGRGRALRVLPRRQGGRS